MYFAKQIILAFTNMQVMTIFKNIVIYYDNWLMYKTYQ